jgi:hypothetical protein
MTATRRSPNFFARAQLGMNRSILRPRMARPVSSTR